MKRKKIYGLLLASLIGTESYSGTMGCEINKVSTAKENLYVGVGVGGRFSTDKISVSSSTYNEQLGLDVLTTGSPTIFDYIITEANSQVVGNIYLGLGHTWMNKYYLGIEADTYFPNYSYYNSRTFFKDYLGLDLLPGMRLQPNSLIYLRGGVAVREITSPDFQTRVPNGHVVGGRFGLGFAYDLTQHFSVAVDNIYTMYPKYKYYNGDFNKINSNQNYFGISLIYSS